MKPHSGICVDEAWLSFHFHCWVWVWVWVWMCECVGVSLLVYVLSETTNNIWIFIDMYPIQSLFSLLECKLCTIYTYNAFWWVGFKPFERKYSRSNNNLDIFKFIQFTFDAFQCQSQSIRSHCYTPNIYFHWFGYYTQKSNSKQILATCVIKGPSIYWLLTWIFTFNMTLCNLLPRKFTWYIRRLHLSR